MKERIVFFILGALVATCAYFAGDRSDLAARDDVLEVETISTRKIYVKDMIVVGGVEVAGRVHITVTTDGVPSIHLFNGTPGEMSSAIRLSCVSTLDPRQHRPKNNKPRLELSSENGLDTYTLTSLGGQYKRQDR
ncbi:MAG: hypothetical protein OXN25_01465 [Candidatus Poribacteria bacterium]|nr:hypothetical protein [Candidatus Poribacteria bacterium]